MEKKLDISLCRESERDALVRFIDEHWKKNHVMVRDSALFDWSYFNPRERVYHFMLIRDAACGEILGMQGFIPNSQFDSALPPTDLTIQFAKVRDNFRGQGLGRLAVKAILDHYRPLSMATLGTSPRAKYVAEQLGWLTGCLNHYYVVNRYKKEFSLLAQWDGRWASETSSSSSSVRYQRVSEGDLIELEAQRLFYKKILRPQKSVNYLAGRYLRHPRFQYHLYAIFRSQALSGLAVIRQVTHGSARALKLVDYVGDTASFVESRSVWQPLLEQYDAEYLEFYHWGWEPETVKQAGFLQRESSTQTIVPTYFNPYEPRNADIVFGYYLSQGIEGPLAIFMGDSDQDRPN